MSVLNIDITSHAHQWSEFEDRYFEGRYRKIKNAVYWLHEDRKHLKPERL
jgi:hypothetical protein